MFCKNCGSQVPEGSGFCVKCGTPAVADAQAPVSQETVVFTPVAEPVQTPMEQTQQFQPVEQTQQFQPVEQYQAVPPVVPAYSNSEPVYYDGASAEKKSRTGLIVVIVVLLLALIGGVVAFVLTDGFGLMGGSSDDDDDEKEETGIVDENDGEGGSGGNGGNGGGEDGGEDDPSGTTQEQERDLTLSKSNMYYDFYVDSSSYVLSASDSRYYSRSELNSMTRNEIYLAEREILARHGCTFNDGDLDEYFGAKEWYSGNYGPAGNFNESQLTDKERVNLLTLRAILMERDGTTNTNEYLKVNNDVDGWILAFTDSSRITKNDVKGLSEKELTIAANEIYARNGYIFDDDKLQTYFASKNWYAPSVLPGSFNTANLSEIERENYTCLLECAAKVKGVRMAADNRYEPYYYSYSEYICPYSNTQSISPYDLEYMSAEELVLARNEIYARYGYSFNHDQLREYFMQCSWYYPTIVPEKLELIHLSKLELANVKMIQAFELNLKLEEGEGKPNTKMSYYAKHDWMTMYLPAHWQDNCICIKPDGTAGNLYFYEKYNEEKNYGYLYSIEFVSTSSSVPSYYGRNVEIYGYVTTPDGSEYYVLKVTPTSDDTVFLEYVYNLMQSQIDTIFKSIVWKDGYTFTAA